jgi:hypothetical protein
MYIRTTTFNYDPAQEAKILQIADELLIPTFQKMPGFVSYMSGFDRTTHQGVAVTVWDSLEPADAAPAGLGDIMQQFEAAGIQFDLGHMYEMVRQI